MRWIYMYVYISRTVHGLIASWHVFCAIGLMLSKSQLRVVVIRAIEWLGIWTDYNWFDAVGFLDVMLRGVCGRWSTFIGANFREFSLRLSYGMMECRRIGSRSECVCVTLRWSVSVFIYGLSNTKQAPTVLEISHLRIHQQHKRNTFNLA